MTVQGSPRKGGIRSSPLSHLYCSTGPLNDLGFTSMFFRNPLPFPADIVTPTHKITLDLRPYYLPEMLRRCISYIDRRSLTLYN